MRPHKNRRGFLMTSGDYGPSWWDVARACEHLSEKWGRSVQLHLGWPVSKNDGTGYSSFVVSVETTALRTGKGKGAGASASFGKGGAWKTAPAAFLAALLAVETELESREAVAKSQTVF